MMPRKRPKSAFFKAAEKFDSDADLANGLIGGIRPHVGGRAFLMADYDRPRPLVIRGCLVAQVRRRNGYARVYVRGRMVIRRLIGRGCGCCPPYFEGAFFSPKSPHLPA